MSLGKLLKLPGACFFLCKMEILLVSPCMRGTEGSGRFSYLKHLEQFLVQILSFVLSTEDKAVNPQESYKNICKTVYHIVDELMSI